MDNQSLSHTKWKCQYHVVFIPKYRRKVMYGKVKQDVREIIKTLCEYKKVKITAGAVCVVLAEDITVSAATITMEFIETIRQSLLSGGMCSKVCFIGSTGAVRRRAITGIVFWTWLNLDTLWLVRRLSMFTFEQ